MKTLHNLRHFCEARGSILIHTPREAHTLNGMNHSRTSQLEHCEV